MVKVFIILILVYSAVGKAELDSICLEHSIWIFVFKVHTIQMHFECLFGSSFLLGVDCLLYTAYFTVSFLKNSDYLNMVIMTYIHAVFQVFSQTKQCRDTILELSTTFLPQRNRQKLLEFIMSFMVL